MLKKQKVLVYLSQILCVQQVENKAGKIVSKIDTKASKSVFSAFPDRQTADFPTNGLAVSKAGYFRKRYIHLFDEVYKIPENPVGINRHKLAIQLIESYGIGIGMDGSLSGINGLKAEQKYGLLEKLIGLYMGRIRRNASR